MRANPQTYLKLAYEEMPRILSLQDRNPFSPTYGSFHRSHWLHRTSDFPSAIAQQGVHSLALLWANSLRDNPYYRKPKILEWCLAGIKYWVAIQKNDGSFDEWYPNERGWAGPTGYLVHAMADSYFLLKDEFSPALLASFKVAVGKAGHYLVEYTEEFVLANHHAIALLGIYEAYLVTGDEALKRGFEKRFEEFLTYCQDEGWSLEYDGADIGYQAGTISFLSRLHRHWPDPRIERLIGQFVEFTSYHLCPDGTYGGSTGSRQTTHFYPFGYEYWAGKVPLAAKMAEQALEFYSRDKLVAPGTQEDHYVLYRVPEFIESRLVHTERLAELPLLPFQRADFEKYFPKAGILIKKNGPRYWIINLCRGGVIKGYDCRSGQTIGCNAGWMLLLENGRVLTSQWNGPEYRHELGQSKALISGNGHYMVMKVFTPWKMILFRGFMMLFGWHAATAYQIKALIRRMLMVGARPGPVRFERSIQFEQAGLVVHDTIWLTGQVKVSELQVGDEFPVRYVPQSRYFQLSELAIAGRRLSQEELQTLNEQKSLALETRICAE